MTNFRDKASKSKLSKSNYGAGSFLVGECGQKWLLVSTADNCIKLLDLTTMELLDGHVKVDDVNWVTEDDMRKICQLTNLNWTISDYDFDIKGLKEKK